MSNAVKTGLLRFALSSAVFLAAVSCATTASAGPICEGGGVDFVSFEGEQIGDTICRTFYANESDSDRAKFYFFDVSTGYSHLLRITVDDVLQDFGLRVHINRLPSEYEYPGIRVIQLHSLRGSYARRPLHRIRRARSANKGGRFHGQVPGKP